MPFTQKIHRRCYWINGSKYLPHFQRCHSILGTELSSSLALSDMIPKTQNSPLGCDYYYYTHLADKQTESHRTWGTCPRPPTSRSPSQDSAQAVWPRASLVSPCLPIAKAIQPRTLTLQRTSAQDADHKVWGSLGSFTQSQPVVGHPLVSAASRSPGHLDFVYWWCIHSFDNHLLSSCCVPGTVLGSIQKKTKQTRASALVKLACSWRTQIRDK